ncbi:MAG TPA: hypothetical protein V6D13_19440 [Halomicronema sp.]|jgi:hypothetical protein
MTNTKSLKGEVASLFIVALAVVLFLVGIPLVLLEIKAPRQPMPKKLLPIKF